MESWYILARWLWGLSDSSDVLERMVPFAGGTADLFADRTKGLGSTSSAWRVRLHFGFGQPNDCAAKQRVGSEACVHGRRPTDLGVATKRRGFGSFCPRARFSTPLLHRASVDEMGRAVADASSTSGGAKNRPDSLEARKAEEAAIFARVQELVQVI